MRNLAALFEGTERRGAAMLVLRLRRRKRRGGLLRVSGRARASGERGCGEEGGSRIALLLQPFALGHDRFWNVVRRRPRRGIVRERSSAFRSPSARAHEKII